VILGIVYSLCVAVYRAVMTVFYWILQQIAGRPLYYCDLQYQIPAKIFGVLGLLLIGLCVFVGIPVSIYSRESGPGPMLLLGLGVGVGLLWLSRVLIRRGSL
jgi:hypothetical protein